MLPARFMAVGCSGLLLMLAACSGGQKQKARAAGAEPAPAVVVTPVRQQTVPIYGEYVGQTEAANTVEIRSQVQGFLTKIAFEEGSIVKQGQLLFVIDPRPYEAALQQAKAALALQQATLKNAQQVVNRYRPLAQQHAISSQQLDSAIAAEKEADAAVESAKAQVAAAQLNLSHTRIETPITGAIGPALVKVGGLVQAGTTLLDTVYSISPMYVTFSISEGAYLNYVKRGRQHRNQPPPIQLILGDGSAYDQTGRINMVAPAVSSTTGTLGIRASFPNPDHVLKPGLFVRVRLVVRNAVNALLIPQTAVQQLQGSESVFVVGPDKKVQQRTITTGATVGNFKIVNSGLKPGEQIVVEGIQKVRPGMTVQTREESEPQAAQLPTASPIPQH
jgi:membrane fusion protein (multidrug efflux system)